MASRRAGKNVAPPDDATAPEDLAKGKVLYNYRLEEGYDELPGLSVFCKDADGTVYHTYSSYARGNEEAMTAYMYLDITPEGRNETSLMNWIRRHDEYEPRQTDVSCT